jgi:galactofuranose transport system permease protein
MSVTPVQSNTSFNPFIWLNRYGTLAAFAALILINIAVTPNFLSWQTLSLNLTQVAPIVIVAVGMTLVIATGGIDLSVGSLMAIAGALAPMFFLGTIIPVSNPIFAVILGLIVPVLATGAFGLFNGFLITRYSVQPIVATLVLFIAGRGIAQVLTNGNLQVFKNPMFQYIGLGRPFGIPFQVILMLAVVISVHFIMQRTLAGRQILAVGGNEKAARLSGIPSARVKYIVYLTSGLLAGLAGLIAVAINSSSDANRVGLGMELDAIAAVAVGGTPLTGGRAFVLSTLLGACVIQLVRYTLLANGIPDAAALIVKAGLIIAAVYIQQNAAKA